MNNEFHEFLKKYYGMTYNSWVCVVEPQRTLIRNSYLNYMTTGNFVKLTYTPETVKVKNKGTEHFVKWLKKSCKISYDCFLSLDFDLKSRIYNEYAKEYRM